MKAIDSNKADAKLKITVVGAGDLGSAILTSLSQNTAHHLWVRDSQPFSPSTVELTQSLKINEATSNDLLESDVVFVTAPARALSDVASTLEGYSGIVVSASVSRAVGRDGLASCAEQLASLLPKAKVVSAFSSMWASVIRDQGSAYKTTAFICSDHSEAIATVSVLAGKMGFEPMNGGSLKMALYTEAMGMFIVNLADQTGWGQRVSYRAFKAT
jgi:predicted dinucleotide-binding enzyme